MKVSDKYYDEVFDFLGQWDVPSKCGLKIINYKNKSIIIVTELYQDNPGTSITYNGHLLAMQICEEKKILPKNIIYIECNPSTNSKLSFYDEEFFLVNFDIENDKFINPTYRQLTVEELQTIIGDEL